LAGYTLGTQQSSPKDLPDFELLQGLIQSFPEAAFILEGKIWDPSQVSQAFSCGAFSVVVGSAITRPHHITARFAKHCPRLEKP
jgi:N-acylglucosamine-6-phosphate 2-epimerase